MRRFSSLLALLIASVVLLAGFRFADDKKEMEAVKNVVYEAYVQGIHNGGEIAAIEKGFHPDFEMLILRDGKLQKYPISEWVAGIKKRRAENPGPPAQTTVHKFTNVDVTGNAAVVRLELSRQDKLIFTDYLMLYKFEDGWKIVGKSFHRH